MTEQEIFEKLKEALNYEYLYTDFGETEVTNLEDYLTSIKREREIEKSFAETEGASIKTYQEFIHYLNDKAIGNTNYIIESFDNNLHNVFLGYKNVTKEIINDKLFLLFEDNDIKLKAEWQAADNYAVWQTCGSCGDDYSGYLLFPTHNDNEYFCLWYNC